MSLNFLCEPNQFHNYAILHFEFVRVVSWHSVEERSQVLTLKFKGRKTVFNVIFSLNPVLLMQLTWPENHLVMADSLNKKLFLRNQNNLYFWKFSAIIGMAQLITVSEKQSLRWTLQEINYSQTCIKLSPTKMVGWPLNTSSTEKGSNAIKEKGILSWHSLEEMKSAMLVCSDAGLMLETSALNLP